ncbi:MAG: DUF4065 domain-containing protein [Rhodospirillales bacterium]|nr:DUF4065 domain-containing protein [Rhodospirillales bacterium]
MPADINNAFDVSIFFDDMATEQGTYLQPQKLQRLLYLAQAYYAVAFNRKLMPAVFVADELGPVEPNVFLAFSRGRPDIDADLFLPYEAQTFLENIWQRFGDYSIDRLDEITNESSAYKIAFARGNRAEIKLADMKKSFKRADKSPGVDQVVKPKIMRTQTGRAVHVQSWTPRKV